MQMRQSCSSKKERRRGSMRWSSNHAKRATPKRHVTNYEGRSLTSRLLGFGFSGGGSMELSCSTESDSGTGAKGSFLGPRQLRRIDE